MPEWLSVPIGLLAGLPLLYGVILFASVPWSRKKRSWFAPRSGASHDHESASVYYGSGENHSDHGGFDGGSGHGQ